jgi:leucyl-tRNA synthetase
VQVQGKVRARLSVPPGIAEDDLERLALDDAQVQRAVDGRPVRRIIVRAPSLVNVVV